MAGVHEIDDPNVGLSGVLAMQAPGVLLQRPPPGHRHREHQGVERWMVEAFANQLAG